MSVLKLKNSFDTNETGLDNYSLFNLRRQQIFLFCEGYMDEGECRTSVGECKHSFSRKSHKLKSQFPMVNESVDFAQT